MHGMVNNVSPTQWRCHIQYEWGERRWDVLAGVQTPFRGRAREGRGGPIAGEWSRKIEGSSRPVPEERSSGAGEWSSGSEGVVVRRSGSGLPAVGVGSSEVQGVVVRPLGSGRPSPGSGRPALGEWSTHAIKTVTYNPERRSTAQSDRQ